MTPGPGSSSDIEVICLAPDGKAKLDSKQPLRANKVLLKCGLVPIGELEAFVGGLGFFEVSATCGATDASTLIDCVFADGRCSAERQVFILDPRGQDSLAAVALAGAFPCVAP